MENKFKRFLSLFVALVMVISMMPVSVFAADEGKPVAQVGNTKYATIDEAIANWTNGTTLTLLADVTLSDVITFKSTEHHILNLGTYTMTAASGKHAIEITCDGRSSASYALTVNADAENPGGITASGKSCIYYKKSDSTKDRPIILINNGVFTGSYSLNITSNGNTNCPQIWINGGTFNSYMNLTKCMLRVSGGTFHAAINCTGDSSAYRQITGGRFKSWQFMTADAPTKFWVGSGNGNYDVGLYVDKEGYLVVGGPVITELSAKYPAVASNYSKWSSYLKYSSAATYGLFYEDPAMAIAKHGESNVTVWEKPAVTIPETVTGNAAVVEEIKNNTALKGYTPENVPAGAELEIELKSVGQTIVFEVAPMANGTKVEPTQVITFRLPIPASVTDTFAKVYHDGETDAMGYYKIQGEGSAKYIEISTNDFSEFAVETVTPTKGYYLTIYNADGTVGMVIDGTKAIDAFSLKSSIEDARVFANNGFLFGITGPATYEIEMFEDSTENASFTIGNDVTINGNGHKIVLGEGVTLTNNGTFNDVTVVEPVTPNYVAQVGTEKYESLQDAIDAAANGATVKLIADIEQVDGVTIENKNLTIDLNGKTFTVSEGASTNNRNIKITGSSVVTIKNGTMVAAGNYSSGAYGTVRTEGTANVTLTDLKLYNYRGNGLNIKACSGTTVTVSNTEIYSQYGGGIEAAGGTIELTNVKVEQKGMYTAPYNSMAISVNGGGKVTVHSGSYSTECITAEEANNQGTSHGPWVAGVLNSGGTLIIKGGTFSNDNFGDNALATAARGMILADTGANIQIEGGIFNALKSVVDIQNNLGDASKNPTGVISGGTFSADPTNGYVLIADGYKVEANADGTFGVQEAKVYVAQIGDVRYESLAEAIAAVQAGQTIKLLAGAVISEGTIQMPATLKNVTIKGAEGAVLKDMTISAADGNSYSYIGLTFDGITFDNSRILLTGWRNGDEIIENLTITNCVFKNIDDTSNMAAVHVNKDVSEPVKNFTFTNNVVDGLTGGSKSGIYMQATGNIVITGNTFNNIVFRPALIQLADCDGLADDVVISDNKISNTTRLQVYGTEEGPDNGPWTPAGTDTMEIAINNNIFQNISGYYICTWGINAETDISGNYYDSEDIGGKIYWNNENPTDAAGLKEIGVYPYYTELNADGTIDTSSAVEAPVNYVAQIGDTYYETLAEAFAAVKSDADTVVILSDVTENLVGAYLRGNITTVDGAKVTITLTNSDWLYCPYTFVLGENITLNVPAIFYYAGGAVIKGKVVAGAYYQRYAGTKLTIEAPGSLTVTSENFILRYTDGDPNAGIYIVGDNDDSTVELKLAVAYFYQGMINAKNATIVCGTYWQTNETDGAGSANLVLDNSKLTVTVYDHPAKATGKSTVTLKNGSVMNSQNGGFTYGDNATISIDATSKIVGKNGVEVEIGLSGEGTEANPYLINNAEDLILFRDSVNAGETKYNAPGVYVALGADIDLTDIDWSVNIGDDCSATFDGIFDGKGYTIKNLTSTESAQKGDGYICTGLFGAIYGSAVIKNLTIDNARINAEYVGNNAGIVVGFAYSCTGSIENVKVTNSTLNAAAVTGTGAIVGYDYYGKLTIKDCVVENTNIIGKSYVGGIIGYGSNNCTVTGCAFTDGDVTANGGCAGGIAGIFLDNAKVENCIVKNANIKAENENWQNSAAVVVGTITSKVTVSGVTVENVNLTAMVGSVSAEKPTAPVAKVAAKIGNTYYATLQAAAHAAKAGDTIILLADIKLLADITVDADNTILIPSGANLVLDLNGFILTGESDETGSNRNMFDVRGTLTVQNGTISYTHKGANMGWGSSTNVFNVTAGGVLNIQYATVENNGGSDMNFVAHLNNWGEVTLNVKNSVLKAGYIPVRVFNSGNDMNNVTIEYSTLESTAGNRVFWVHNFINDLSGTAAETVEARLNFNIFGNGNTFKVYNVDANRLFEYGFTNAINLDANGNYVARNEWALNYALSKGGKVTLGADLNLSSVLLIDKSITIDGNGHKVTSSASRVIRLTTSNIDVTINDLNMVNTKASSYTADIRGISIDAGLSNVKLTLNNCSVDFTDATACDWSYAVNVSGNGTGHVVTVNGGTYEGANVINAHGANNTIVVKNATLNCLYPNSDSYAGACIWVLQNQGSSVEATGNTFNGTNALAFNVGTGTTVIESNNTDNTTYVVAKIGDAYYTSLADALAAAQEGETITLLAPIVVNAGEILEIDLAGKTIQYTSSVVGEDMITNYGNLTINDSVGGGQIVYINTDTTGSNVTVSTITNAPGGELTINGGTIENASVYNNNSIYPFAIDNLTNGTLGTAKTTINGGTIKSNYRSVRLFANSTSDRNTVNINGGNFFGQVWLQASGAKAHKVTLVINGGTFAPVGNDYSSVFVETLGTTKPTFRVLGGTFTTKIGTDNVAMAANYGIAGGTFTAAAMQNTPEGLIRSGYEFVQNADGTYGVETIKVIAITDAAGNVTKYASVDEAVRALKDGDTITLLKNVTKGFTVSGKSVTLDLNGYTLSQSGAAIFVEDGASLTIVDSSDAKTGKITATNDAITVENGTLIIESGIIESTGGDAISASYAQITINGGKLVAANNAISMIVNSASAPNVLTINGGEIVAGDYAIATNGTYDYSTITIKGGKLTGELGGIYHSAEGVLAISGGEISGNVGLKIMAGTVTISGGKISGTEAAVSVYYQGANTGYGDINVAITGGEFAGAITSTAADGLEAKTGFITGGTFSNEVDSGYLADGYVCKDNGDGTCGVAKYLIMVAYKDGTVAYFNDILEAVPYKTNYDKLEGATITLLGDITGKGIRFMEADMVLDLNGYTYTINNATGSSGTNTSGFQIREQAVNAIIKNGTIQIAASADMVENPSVVYFFNNYSENFIVENVTIDCTNMDWSYGSSCYVVVTRDGDKVQFLGNTKVENFNAAVAGVAYSVGGGTMTVGENVILGGAVKLAVGATMTAPAGLEVVTAEGYGVVYNNGVYAAVKYVAQIGETKYDSLYEAIEAAVDGDTIYLLPGTITERVVHECKKSITIIGAENFGTVMTGGLYLGYDNSQCLEYTITIKGIAFEGKGILVASRQNVVIDGNKFTNIHDYVATSQSASQNAISVIGSYINATITNNVIDGVTAGKSSGIHLRDVKTAVVSGNTVTNTHGNSITINKSEDATGVTAVVENNILSNWGTSGEGRAIRSTADAGFTAQGNVMIHTNAPEQFVKVTDTTNIDVSENYWNGVDPTTGKYFTDDDGEFDAVAIIKSYYTDEAKTNLVELKNEVEKFKIDGASMTLGNSLAINFFVEPSDLKEGESYYAVITKEYADGSENVVVRVEQAEWSWSANYKQYYVSFNGVAAKEMCDKLTVVIYNSQGEAVSEAWVDSIRDYTMRVLLKEEAKASPNAEKLTLYVDMLNYGAAAQTEFGYNEADLANNQLTEAQKLYATKSENVTLADNRVKGEGYSATNLTLRSDITMNFFFLGTHIPAEHNDYYAIATFVNHYGEEQVIRIEGKDFAQLKNDTDWYVPVKGVVVADCRQLVTVTVYDADGNMIATGADSIESYVYRNKDKKDIYMAIMKFAVSAYASFH